MKKEATYVRKSGLMLLAICLWLLPTAVGAAPGDKKVSVDFKSVPVKTVLNAIQKQAGLNFVYSSQLAATWPTVSITAKQKPAVQVIDQLTSMINCSYKINGDVVSISPQQMSGRQRTIKGYVRDDSGEPLVGVPVCIGESRVCTVTDAEGFYTFKIPVEKTVLKFSYVGMENTYITIPQGNSDVSRDVTMRSDSQLEEVVVTGYQTISKKNMTGSTATITAETLQDRYTSDVVSNLEGRIAGLSTYGGELKIRGTSSLYAETSPLLVVDGLPMEGKITDINIYDIATINVLKDAAATAIYGARASNGVIVITTKNARKKGKVDIDFSANLTMKEDRNLDYNDNFYMNAEQQVKLESEYYDYYYRPRSEGGLGGTASYVFSQYRSGTNAISALHYAYYRKAAGEISDEELSRIKSQLSKNNFAKEFGDVVYRKQLMQEYNLSLRSSSEKTNNNVTLNYKHDNTGVINAMNRQFTINYKGMFELSKWLTANISINALYSKNQSQGYDESSYASVSRIWQHPAYETLYDKNGAIRKLYGSYDGNSYYDVWTREGTVDLGTNPVDELYNNVRTNNRQHMRYHGELLFKIFEGFTASAQYVYETDHAATEWYANSESHPARVIRNAYTVQDADGSVRHITPDTGGMKRFTNTDGRYWTARGQLNYMNTFGKHAINALAGLEFREVKSWGNNALLLGYDDQLQTSLTSNVNFGELRALRENSYSLPVGYISSQYAFEPYIEQGMSLITERIHRYGSGYANFTYTYDERYNVFASWRKDYADVFGLNVKYRGKPLWSVGGAWNIDSESFMDDYKWVNYLKLRFSYGGTGNIYQNASSYMTASTGEVNYYTLQPMATIKSPGNPELRWETSHITNIGIDYSLFNNRLRGALDYYLKNSKDVFSRKPLDATSGFSSLVVNSAKLRNNGVELLLTAEWFLAKSENDFGWSTTFTFTHNNNKVVSVENPSTYAYELISNPYVEGYPSSALWSYRFAGISDGTKENGYGASPGQTLWYGNDGIIQHSVQRHSTDIMEYGGQTDPKVIVGMGNEWQWKNFTLGLQMAYYGGHVMRCLTEREGFAPSYSTIASYFVNAWTPENKTNTPGFGQYASGVLGLESYYGSNSVYDASFLKIRNIVVGYNVPRKWLHAIGVNRMRLQFQLDNPKALWTANDKGVDPETLGVRTRSNYIFSLNVNL